MWKLVYAWRIFYTFLAKIRFVSVSLIYVLNFFDQNRCFFEIVLDLKLIRDGEISVGKLHLWEFKAEILMEHLDPGKKAYQFFLAQMLAPNDDYCRGSWFMFRFFDDKSMCFDHLDQILVRFEFLDRKWTCFDFLDFLGYQKTN